MCNTRKSVLKKVEKNLKANGYNYLDAASLENLFKNSTINKYINDNIGVEVISSVEMLEELFNNTKWHGEIYTDLLLEATLHSDLIQVPRLKHEYHNKIVEVIKGVSIPGNINYNFAHLLVDEKKPTINSRELIIFILTEEKSLRYANPYFVKTIYIYIPKGES